MKCKQGTKGGDKMLEQEAAHIIKKGLYKMKMQGTIEWRIFYEYVINLQNEVEEKDREIAKLKEDIENLNNDIAENYRPIPRAEQYDMGECNFH